MPLGCDEHTNLVVHGKTYRSLRTVPDGYVCLNLRASCTCRYPLPWKEWRVHNRYSEFRVQYSWQLLDWCIFRTLPIPEFYQPGCSVLEQSGSLVLSQVAFYCIAMHAPKKYFLIANLFIDCKGKIHDPHREILSLTLALQVLNIFQCTGR